jgi:hypothetical protein
VGGVNTQSPSISISRLGRRPSLLGKKAHYIPPNHMKAHAVLKHIWDQEPSLARVLYVERGKITADNRYGQARLKMPLLPSSKISCLRFPLPREVPNGTVFENWLTDPLEDVKFDPLALGLSQEVVSISKFQWYNNKTVYKVTTALKDTSGVHQQKGTRLIECGNKCVRLVKAPTITRCTFCQALDHSKFVCAEESPKCVNCAGIHESNKCPVPFRRKCTRCGGKHKASHTLCPDYIKIMKNNGCVSLGQNQNQNVPNSIPSLLSLPPLPRNRLMVLFPVGHPSRQTIMNAHLTARSEIRAAPLTNIPTPPIHKEQYAQGSTKSPPLAERVVGSHFPGEKIQTAIDVLVALSNVKSTSQISQGANNCILNVLVPMLQSVKLDSDKGKLHHKGNKQEVQGRNPNLIYIGSDI